MDSLLKQGGYLCECYRVWLHNVMQSTLISYCSCNTDMCSSRLTM